MVRTKFVQPPYTYLYNIVTSIYYDFAYIIIAYLFFKINTFFGNAGSKNVVSEPMKIILADQTESMPRKLSKI